MRAVGFDLSEQTYGWIKNAAGEKTVVLPADGVKKPKAPNGNGVAKKRKGDRVPYQDRINAKNAMPSTPAAGTGSHASEPAPRAQRNAESEAAALKGIAARAKGQGNKQMARSLTAKAKAILERFAGGNQSNGLTRG
jgi:hypothetical protein